MGFATRSDLLKRANARSLVKLAVPADRDSLPDDALRVAIADGDLSAYTEHERETLSLMLETIDQALLDADAFIQSYGVPATAQSTILARLSSTIAHYYLYSTEDVPENVQRAYDGSVATLKAFSRGEVNLVGVVGTEPAASPEDASVAFFASPRRYGDGRRQVASAFDEEDDA